MKYCETLCHNVEKPSSTHVHRTAAWDRLSQESSVGVLHFAGGCFNVASLRDRGQRLPFLVTPPRAQARQVTLDSCSHAGRLQPAEDLESAGSDFSFRLHCPPLGPRAIWATMFHNVKTILCNIVKHCVTMSKKPSSTHCGMRAGQQLRMEFGPLPEQHLKLHWIASF